MVGRLHHLAARPHRRHRLAHARQRLRNPLHDPERDPHRRHLRYPARSHPLRDATWPLSGEPLRLLPAWHHRQHWPLHPLHHPRLVDRALHPLHRRRLHWQHRRHRPAHPLRRPFHRPHGGKHAERSPRRPHRSSAGHGGKPYTNHAQSAAARSPAWHHQRPHHHPHRPHRLFRHRRRPRRGRAR